MVAPNPQDPLDGPIIEFLHAVDGFLSMPMEFDTPEPVASAGPNPNWADVQRVWEDAKRALRKAHVSFVGVQPEITESLEVVTDKGAVVLELTDDPNIVGPVTELMELMTEVRAVIDRLESTLGRAQSVLGFVTLTLETVGLKARLVPLSTRTAIARDALIAYNLLRPRPNGAA